MNFLQRRYIKQLRFLAITLAMASSVFSLAADTATKGEAETVLSNGRIYTMNPRVPWVDTIVVGGGKYLYAGNAQGAAKYLHKNTAQVDLGGKMLMPGINDGHAHPWQGGVKMLFNCNFKFTATPDEVAMRLRACIAASPNEKWLTGGQWSSDFFSNYDIPSPRKWLDAIANDRPIYLNDDATHNAWVNSKAFELAGINSNTPDPEGGTFVRDQEGQLSGLVYEQARQALKAVIPDWTISQYREAIAVAVQQANRFGLTGVNEARADADVLGVYQAMDKAGGLSLHVAVDHQTPRGYRDQPLDIATIVADRDKYQSDHVHTSFVKLFLDGVPTASRTAYMLKNYTLAKGESTPGRGHLMIPPEILREDLIALDKLGFTTKIHAAGDASVRVGLDAIEAARKMNGNSGLQHQLAHAGFIAPADLHRFAQLNVTADLSPYIWYPSPVIDSIVGAVGERGSRYFPVKQLLDSGASVLMGSDWPSVANNLSPWHAIEALVTRQNPFTDAQETLWAEQAITLQQALKVATLDGAAAMRLDHLTGSIEVGKSADFIILDRNLFEIPVHGISDTEVEQTWFEGARVYNRR